MRQRALKKRRGQNRVAIEVEQGRMEAWSPPAVTLVMLEDHIEDDDPGVKRDAVRVYTRPSYAEFEKEERLAQDEFLRELYEEGSDYESLDYDEGPAGLLKHDRRTGEKMIGSVYIPAREMCPQFQTNDGCRFGFFCPLRHTYTHEAPENPDLIRPMGDGTGPGVAPFDEEAD